jgi:hypothetical protein
VSADCEDGTTVKAHAHEAQPITLTYLVQASMGIKP